MTANRLQHSARFNADIEYNPTDPSQLTITDQDEEVLTYWGIDDDGVCYFISFVNGVFDDSQTEEA